MKVAGAGAKELDFYEGISIAAELIEGQTASGGKLIFIGNGASAAISSHQATDFWKNGGMKAIAFNDASGLTCISNDFGYDHVFEKPIKMFGNAGDVLIAISSSGRSENILRAVTTAKVKGVEVITLSGFSEDNRLRFLGKINFYVPSSCYGHVEILHLSICHCLLDIIIQNKTEPIVEVAAKPAPGHMVSVSESRY
jgi:D-sedoheptulose 7-phosphate isomerase